MKSVVLVSLLVLTGCSNVSYEVGETADEVLVSSQESGSILTEKIWRYSGSLEGHFYQHDVDENAFSVSSQRSPWNTTFDVHTKPYEGSDERVMSQLVFPKGLLDGLEGKHTFTEDSDGVYSYGCSGDVGDWENDDVGVEIEVDIVVVSNDEIDFSFTVDYSNGNVLSGSVHGLFQ